MTASLHCITTKLNDSSRDAFSQLGIRHIDQEKKSIIQRPSYSLKGLNSHKRLPREMGHMTLSFNE